MDYGLSATYGNTAFVNMPPATAHSLTLTGLAADTRYHYRVKSRGASGELALSQDHAFTTSAPPQANAAVAEDAPLVLIMNPASGALVTGAATVSANAISRAGVTGVQFLLDGRDIAPISAAAPYTFSWNSASVADGEHILAAVARDAAGRTATSPAIAVSVDNNPPLITAVSAAAVSDDGAVILWTTNERADSQVDYGMTPAYGNSTPLSASRVMSRAAALSGLASGALYHYRVKSRDAAGFLSVSNDYTFITTGEAAGALTQAAKEIAAAGEAAARAPQKILSPALADGINDQAVFGPEAREVSIVDLGGRRVFHASSSGPPIVWNCRDDSGRIVPSGVYVARVVTRDGKSYYQNFAVAK